MRLRRNYFVSKFNFQHRNGKTPRSRVLSRKRIVSFFFQKYFLREWRHERFTIAVVAPQRPERQLALKFSNRFIAQGGVSTDSIPRCCIQSRASAAPNLSPFHTPPLRKKTENRHQPSEEENEDDENDDRLPILG